jgi:ABC-type proline/glycine betaine transport system permease subunit
MYLIRVMSTMPPIALLVLFAIVFTFVGLGPTLAAARFLATADLL